MHEFKEYITPFMLSIFVYIVHLTKEYYCGNMVLLEKGQTKRAAPLWKNFLLQDGDNMPIAYKIDILQALKEKGYTTYRLRKDKVFSEATMQAFRSGTMVSYNTISKLCEMLECDIGDLLHYVPTV